MGLIFYMHRELRKNRLCPDQISSPHNADWLVRWIRRSREVLSLCPPPQEVPCQNTLLTGPQNFYAAGTRALGYLPGNSTSIQFYKILMWDPNTIITEARLSAPSGNHSLRPYASQGLT